MKTILLKAQEIGNIKATLLTETAPNTCTKFWEALPLKVSLSTWGDELYGTIPVDIEACRAQAFVYCMVALPPVPVISPG